MKIIEAEDLIEEPLSEEEAKILVEDLLYLQTIENYVRGLPIHLTEEYKNGYKEMRRLLVQIRNL